MEDICSCRVFLSLTRNRSRTRWQAACVVVKKWPLPCETGDGLLCGLFVSPTVHARAPSRASRSSVDLPMPLLARERLPALMRSDACLLPSNLTR